MEPVATCCFENFWQQSRIHTEAGDERRSIRPARRAWIPSLQTVLGLLADHCPALPTRTDGSLCSILGLAVRCAMARSFAKSRPCLVSSCNASQRCKRLVQSSPSVIEHGFGLACIITKPTDDRNGKV